MSFVQFIPVLTVYIVVLCLRFSIYGLCNRGFSLSPQFWLRQLVILIIRERTFVVQGGQNFVVQSA
jgi:hypothetical protein